MKKLLFLMLLSLNCLGLKGQGMAFGVKGGLTLAFQKWNNYERSVLPSSNVVLFLESLAEEKRFSVFSQLGYHIKGSRIRSFYREFSTNNIKRITIDTKFRNVALVLGMRSAYDIKNSRIKGYYLMGIRGDYNINYHLDNRVPIFKAEDVNKFTYGLTLGGGIEIPFTSLIGMILEVQVSPDIRPQVFYPANKYTTLDVNGNEIPAQETKIINTVFEITLGFRFLRLVEYID